MATPTVIQHVSTSNSLGGALITGAFRLRLPEKTKSGNCLVLACQGDHAWDSDITVTDDKGNVWNKIRFADDTSNAQGVWIFVALGIAADTRVISINRPGSPSISFISAVATEFNNIASASADDGSNGNFGSSATITAGSITPTTSGDLFYQFVARDSGTIATSSFTAGSQSNIAWKLLSADLQDGSACQYGIYNSTSAINPTMTAGTSSGFVSACITLKQAATGSTRSSGIKVVSILHQSQPAGISNPSVVQFPSVGNLLVFAYSTGNPSFVITGITDNLGNSWVQAPGSANTSNSQDTTQWWYVKNAISSSTLAITVTYNSTASNDGTIMFYDIIGASSDPYDTRTTSTGNQAVAGNLTAPASLTPSTSNGIVLMMEQHEFNTANGLTNSNFIFDSIEFDNMSVDGPQNMDQNGGWAHYYNADTNPISFTWTFIGGSEALNIWAADAIAFKAGSTRRIFSIN